MIKMKKGFTLIELLVVIAIIGILSSVVLASLNSARAKGSDAAVKSGMSNFQAQAALYYDGEGNQTYGVSTACSGSEVGGVFVDAQSANIIANVVSNASSVACSASTTGTVSSYYVLATLRGAGHWCVDSNGNATGSSVTIGGFCQ